jgi:hypothetical protein
MKIKYEYKILNVNEEAKTMEVLYTCKKYGEYISFIPLPKKDETLEDKIFQYNPTQYWIDKEAQVQEVKKGQKGVQEIDVYHPDHPDDLPQIDEENFDEDSEETPIINDKDREIVIAVLREIGLTP